MSGSTRSRSGTHADRRNTIRRLFGTATVLGLLLAGCSGPPTPFLGRVDSFTVVGPHRIMVAFVVRNQSSRPGAGSCDVRAETSAGNTTDTRYTSPVLSPGESRRQEEFLDVADNASNIHRVTVVDCEAIAKAGPAED